jgi:amino acid transporter
MEKDIEESAEGPAYHSSHGQLDSSVESKQGTKFTRFVDSFKRNPNARMVTELTDAEGKPLPEQPPAKPALSMSLKGRHLQMIAIGGSIGNNTSHSCR